MKSLRNRMLVIAAVALAVVCASAVPASAQLVCKGSFTLSQEVHWQTATLPPGDYTFEMQSLASPSRIVLRGPNGSSFISAIVADELRLSPIGRTLRYAVPKPRKETEVAQAPVTREHILVAVNVK